jgi:hypothetical protein
MEEAHITQGCLNPFSYQGGWKTAYSQSPGDIVLDHGSDNLVIGLLKNHTDRIANMPLIGYITRIQASNQDLPAFRQQ